MTDNSLTYRSLYVALTCLSLACCCCVDDTGPASMDWAYYQGDPGSNQYSPADQINRRNVGELEIAWTYACGDGDSLGRSQIQCNPLIIDGTLYGTSPKLKLFALDAATGKHKWTFDPFVNSYEMYGMGVNRGLAFWSDGDSQRIYFGAGSFLYAVNALDGVLHEHFGDEGRVDLHVGLGAHAAEYFIAANSPGVIYKDLYIIGVRVSEAMGAAPGDIRAFDVHSGELRWTFHTIPQPGEFGHQTWPANSWRDMGGANAWSGLSIDHEREIVFVPTGSAAYDFYGGDRHGENLFANSLIALDANTGERIWHFQTIRHDLWDRDLPAPPNLVNITKDGKNVEAVAQITKAGFVFLFERETGRPIFPMEEISVPSSHLRGEAAWPTQLVPSKPPRFSRHIFAEKDITQRTPEAHAYVRAIWHSLQKGTEFIPPSEEGTLLLPGFDGGGEWGGAAVDLDGIMYVNASEMPWIIKMIEYQTEEDGLLSSKGRNIYGTQCQLCHGADKKGASIYTVPSLENLKARKTEADVASIIKNGQGMMPSFAFLNDGDIRAITAFLFDSQELMTPEDKKSSLARQSWKYPYFMSGYVRFKDHEGFPALTPPWGTLNAIDLNQGILKWKVTLGQHPDIELTGDSLTGTENYGGPIVTAGDLLFIAATMDEKIRAFDKYTGALLWQHDLPAAGYATPASYVVNGKQYIVIACGGGKIGSKSGDSYVAFSL
ncbi:MAG: PQQ-binding-like beta-propeller repeat protein [Saprospiraceae bacterium]|nr:PQQ-binding-like beta-propeller repeat protein [Saprospiraceae bacterium]